MQQIEAQFGEDYELIDSGGFEKLERFGGQVLVRPEPQALWSKGLTAAEWEKGHTAKFERKKAAQVYNREDAGQWVIKAGTKEQWTVQFSYQHFRLVFRLGLTGFKHVGIFPEQADNWRYIIDRITAMKTSQKKVLNLFAYTGGASLAARAAGAEVVHVDAVKQVISWSRENMELSGLDGIRWVVEDALKFVQREVRRGTVYQGIILDPPAYGRGPEGEKWVLEEKIGPLLLACAALLDKVNGFVVINLYSMGYSPLVLDNLFREYFHPEKEHETGELFVTDKQGHRLPLGLFLRFQHGC